MKKNMAGPRLKQALLALLLLPVLLTLPIPSQADTINLVADEWCPYNCEPDTDEPGYMIEIAQRVFSEAGHTVTYRTLNWSRSVEDTRHGKYDGIVGASKPEAEDFVFPDENLGDSANSFFVTKENSWRYQGMPSIEKVRIAVIKDYEYGTLLDDYIAANKTDLKKVQVATGDTALEKNFTKLVNGRIAVVIEDGAVGRYTAKSMGLADKVQFAGNDGDPSDLYIAFSPKNPKSQEYAKILSKGIERLRSSGELQTILEKYGQTDWR